MLRDRGVHSRSRVFTRERLGVVAFIRFRVGSLGRAKLSLGLFRFAWVHSGALRFRCRVQSDSRGFAPARIAVVVFIPVRVGSLGSAYVSSDSIGFVWVHSGAPRGRRVRSVSRSIVRARIAVVVPIRVRVGSLWVSSGSIRFSRVHSGTPK